MSEYSLVLIYSPKIFDIKLIPKEEFSELVNKYTDCRIELMLQSAKSKCNYLYSALLQSNCVIKDSATGKQYAATVEKAMNIINTANTEFERVQLHRIDLNTFVSMWSRLTAHFPEYNKSNELITNAEYSDYKVYPTMPATTQFVIETDNPNSLSDILTFKSVTTDGTVAETLNLSTPESKTWQVQYTITNAIITCIKTEIIDVEKSKIDITDRRGRTYKYEFLSSLPDAIHCVLATNFEPKWY